MMNGNCGMKGWVEKVEKVEVWKKRLITDGRCHLRAVGRHSQTTTTIGDPQHSRSGEGLKSVVTADNYLKPGRQPW
jgi:hypothetical protein